MKSKPSYLSVFPSYGMWDSPTTFRTSKAQENRYVGTEAFKQESAENSLDRSNFRKLYFEKEYMNELLRTKHMLTNKRLN